MPHNIYKVAETFHSVQGEGQIAGQQAFFIRLHGCNLKCQFDATHSCDDSAHSGPDFKMMSLMDLEREARKIPTTLNIIITGGEVTLVKNIDDLITFLSRMGFFVSVETNGQFIERLVNADLITYSPKNQWDKNARLISYDEYDDMLDGQMPPVELKLLASVANPVNEELWDAYPVKYVQAISFEHKLDKTNLDYVCDFVVH
ncbi:MAG: 7-carboxy-7-deazaguanine synthase QueE, partial [Ignisphaera sp.]|nr:7-carboxy-7-deazaguanine synthase QueE [Ignisphaera sp.]